MSIITIIEMNYCTVRGHLFFFFTINTNELLPECICIFLLTLSYTAHQCTYTLVIGFRGW